MMFHTRTLLKHSREAIKEGVEEGNVGRVKIFQEYMGI